MRKTEERSLEKLRKNLNTETKCENYKRNKSSIHGITLIALVITIVVLLILAGVGIATLTGQNSILTQANNAKKENKTESDIEAIKLASTVDYIAWYSGNYPEDEDPFLEELRKTDPNATIDWDYSEDEILIYYNDDDYIFDFITGEIYSKQKQEEEQLAKAMKIKVNTGDDGSVVLPILGDTDCTIDWGDGTITANKKDKENVKVASLNDTIKLAAVDAKVTSHEYAEKGVDKTVTIIGVVDKLDSDYYNVTRDKIIEIEKWGETGLQEVYLGYCENLRKIASPTEKSFENMTKFDSTFSGCTSLTEIPEDLFANCPNVINFNSTFSRCTSLTEIPEDLFANCPNVTRFMNTFYNCTSLTGAPIELWTRGDNSEENSYMGTPNGAGCYYNCTGLDRYESIPSYWRAAMEK